jgi:mono/diheme cytochrome c family protein
VVRATGATAAAIAAKSLMLGAAACGEQPPAGEVREWTPADHAHAEDVPVEDGAGEGEASSVARGQGTGAAPETAEQQEARAAAALWSVSCVPCHGPAGRGDGPARPAGVAVADLSDAAWQRARSDEQIAAVIAQGRGVMPGFGEQLSPRGILALVKHVRRLAAPTR